MSDHSDHEPNLLDKILETEPSIKSTLGARAFAQDTLLDLQGKPAVALMQRFPGLHVKQAQRLKDRLKVTDAGRVKWLLTGSVMETGWVQGRITSTVFPGNVWKLPPFYVGWNPEEAGPPPEDEALAQQGVNDVSAVSVRL